MAFIAAGLYFPLQSVRIVATRNLLKKIFLLCAEQGLTGKQGRIVKLKHMLPPLQQIGLRDAVGGVFELDDLQCALQSLIANKYLKAQARFGKAELEQHDVVLSCRGAAEGDMEAKLQVISCCCCCCCVPLCVCCSQAGPANAHCAADVSGCRTCAAASRSSACGGSPTSRRSYRQRAEEGSCVSLRECLPVQIYQRRMSSSATPMNVAPRCERKVSTDRGVAGVVALADDARLYRHLALAVLALWRRLPWAYGKRRKWGFQGYSI